MAVDTRDTRVADKIGLARRGVGVAGPGRPPSAPRKGRGK
ncbi:sugar ABC transporter permease, partial [Clavibacter phaseoli]